MKKFNNSGFTAIELLVTLFIAAAFLVSGYQIYTVIIKDNSNAQQQAVASNFAYDYLQRYKANVANSCTVSTPLADSAVVINGLSNTTATVSISCPFGTTSSTSKISVDIKYGIPQQTVSYSTYTSSTCPKGFIPVPGSPTYGTSDFCVMKYEAKVDTAGNIVSSPVGLPDVSKSQSEIMQTYAPSACDGCHLISEAEWMTIAQNVLNVPSNWSSGIVGTNYIFSGHNDNAPSRALEADSKDSNGYAGETNVNGNQRRTLTLSNGEIIWDFAGNVNEWTSGQNIGSQPGVSGFGYGWRDWVNVTTPGSSVINPFPSGTGISNAGTWTGSTNGIGYLYSSTLETGLKGSVRGGTYSSNSIAGVLSLDLSNNISSHVASIGYRVAR